MKMHKRIIILINLVIVMAVFNWSVRQKEKTLAHARLILLPLAPVDPRSLMQGDYMRLNYAMANSVFTDTIPPRGYCVVTLDSVGVAQYVRLQETATPHADNEYLIRYNRAKWSINIGAESFFFQEGLGNLYDSAEYGGLKVDEHGNSVLIGLYDADRQLIDPDIQSALQED